MAAGGMQSVGPITIEPPPGGESLVFRSMTLHEELGRPFICTMEFLNESPTLKAADILGQLITVHLELRNGELRHFNGFITELVMVGSAGSYARYMATVQPWLWFLTRTSGCRIFQNLTVPEILKKVFRDLGFTDFEESLSGDYAAHDYVVQYRESDFDFVSRLMEQEGIYYFFKHTDGNHKLVLADSYSAHSPVSGYEEIPYYQEDQNRGHEIDFVDRWQSTHRIRSGAYAVTDFDFQRPRANLMAKVSHPNSHAKGDFEVYDYPGAYQKLQLGESYARIRLEEIHTDYAVAKGRTNARGQSVGSLFSLTEHPVDDQNIEYLVTAANYELRTHDPQSGGELPPDDVYRCEFAVIESARQYRPARITRKPIVSGPQTAIVVGKSGEEIWTDDNGRVKVQFHWDRVGKGDENSSCWVRVAQLWAGSGWGGLHVPRIGQEVIVDFLEGDPDCPIITGRVYNGDNKPPFGLPANQTQSGIKSRSSKGGGPSNFNELRFEDKKGSEEVYVQAEKDMNTLVKHDETRLVKNDQTTTVNHDQTLEVGHDRQKTVKNNETVKVIGNRTETVLKSESITIGASRSETVAMMESISIGAARSTTVGGADALEVGAAQSVSVGGARSISVGGVEGTSIGGARSVSIGGHESISVGGSRTEDVAKDESVAILGKRTHDVKKDDVLNVGKKLQINVTDEIVIKAGDATISMKKNGDIIIKGKNITLDGSGKVNVKASGDVIMKGSKIGQN